jgi:hypothetical protein
VKSGEAKKVILVKLPYQNNQKVNLNLTKTVATNMIILCLIQLMYHTPHSLGPIFSLSMGRSFGPKAAGGGLKTGQVSLHI